LLLVLMGPISHKDTSKNAKNQACSPRAIK